MRKMLLSMQPFWKEKIMSGEKIYEYRNRFPKEEILAYLYVSAPVSGISGIIYLGNYFLLEDWKVKYARYPDVIETICAYENRKNRMAMPILGYQETNTITREMWVEKLGKFVVPQSYYYLNDTMELTKYVESAIEVQGIMKINKFMEDDLSNLCKKYR